MLYSNRNRRTCLDICRLQCRWLGESGRAGECCLHVLASLGCALQLCGTDALDCNGGRRRTHGFRGRVRRSSCVACGCTASTGHK